MAKLTKNSYKRKVILFGVLLFKIGRASCRERV